VFRARIDVDKLSRAEEAGMLQETINTAFQLAVVLIIALVVWLVFARKRASFWAYVGLIRPKPSAMLWALAAALILVPSTLALFMIPELRNLAAGPNTIAGHMRDQGLSGDVIGQILLVAFIKTSLSEEIFFRGLIAKRLINGLGFVTGNTLHAVLFGAVHMLIFLVPGGPKFDPLIAGAFFLVTGGGGWIMAWLNERVGNGSIAPSWLLHGLSNAIAYPVLAFA
jgi:membrane protease YdiL (CAAX protease family)